MTPTLAPPEDALKVSVVVPARDEEELIGKCLLALATQQEVSPEEYEVLLVLDDCTDGTEEKAREVAGEYPLLRLRFLDGPGKGAGHARRVGMEAACARLLALGREDGLISSTDADTTVAPNWLAAQLAAAARGARAIGGRIELPDESALPDDVSLWRAEQGHKRHLDLLEDLDAVREPPARTEHWQFSGASLALTAATYREIGGLEPRAALEDEYLERVLRQRSIPIERPMSVRVVTSDRLFGRASRGLSRDLALISWSRRNTFHARDFGEEYVLSIKDRSVSLIWPGHVSDSQAGELRRLQSVGLVDEVISTDPQVLASGYGPVRGFGDLFWRSLSVASAEVVVVLDPADPEPSSVAGLLGALFSRDDLRMVKGFRDLSAPNPTSELLARPLINLYTPDLAGFCQPLSLDFAANRALLGNLSFPVGEGIRISLLLDAAKKAGVQALAQVDLDEEALQYQGDDGEAAYQILAAAISRALGSEKLADYAPGPLILPHPERLESRRVALEERPPLASLETV